MPLSPASLPLWPLRVVVEVVVVVVMVAWEEVSGAHARSLSVVVPSTTAARLHHAYEAVAAAPVACTCDAERRPPLLLLVGQVGTVCSSGSDVERSGPAPLPPELGRLMAPSDAEAATTAVPRSYVVLLDAVPCVDVDVLQEQIECLGGVLADGMAVVGILSLEAATTTSTATEKRGYGPGAPLRSATPSEWRTKVQVALVTGDKLTREFLWLRMARDPPTARCSSTAAAVLVNSLRASAGAYVLDAEPVFPAKHPHGGGSSRSREVAKAAAGRGKGASAPAGVVPAGGVPVYVLPATPESEIFSRVDVTLNPSFTGSPLLFYPPRMGDGVEEGKANAAAATTTTSDAYPVPLRHLQRESGSLLGLHRHIASWPPPCRECPAGSIVPVRAHAAQLGVSAHAANHGGLRLSLLLALPFLSASDVAEQIRRLLRKRAEVIPSGAGEHAGSGTLGASLYGYPMSHGGVAGSAVAATPGDRMLYFTCIVPYIAPPPESSDAERKAATRSNEKWLHSAWKAFENSIMDGCDLQDDLSRAWFLPLTHEPGAPLTAPAAARGNAAGHRSPRPQPSPSTEEVAKSPLEATRSTAADKVPPPSVRGATTPTTSWLRWVIPAAAVLVLSAALVSHSAWTMDDGPARGQK